MLYSSQGFGGYPPASPRSQPTSYPEPSGYPPPSGFSPPSNNFPQPPPGYHHVPQPVVTQPHPTGAGDQSKFNIYYYIDKLSINLDVNDFWLCYKNNNYFFINFILLCTISFRFKLFLITKKNPLSF